MGIVGYARVSTREQNPDAQEAELVAAGAQRVFVDRGESSRTADRPEWVACLDYLRAGDTLVIRALDRIAGTELMVIELIRGLGRRGIRLRSLAVIGRTFGVGASSVFRALAKADKVVDASVCTPVGSTPSGYATAVEGASEAARIMSSMPASPA